MSSVSSHAVTCVQYSGSRSLNLNTYCTQQLESIRSGNKEAMTDSDFYLCNKISLVEGHACTQERTVDTVADWSVIVTTCCAIYYHMTSGLVQYMFDMSSLSSANKIACL